MTSCPINIGRAWIDHISSVEKSTCLLEAADIILLCQLDNLKIFEWAWSAASCPILSALGMNSLLLPERDWLRIWWIPKGLLSIIPFFATERRCHGSLKTVLDLAVSSYSFSVCMLTDVRR